MKLFPHYTQNENDGFTGLIVPAVILHVNMLVARLRGEVLGELVDNALLGNIERQRHPILFE